MSAETEAGARTQIVSRAGAELFVSERGDLANPAVVLVHGFPDTHAMWDELVGELSGQFHTVAYDVRGMGRSIAPDGADAYLLPELALDLQAVIEAVSPDRPVHLVGHDWGAFQCWEAATADDAAQRIASFTAVAGPKIDAAAAWVLRRLRLSASGIKDLLGQARRSWYVGAVQIPGLPERALGAAMDRAWPRVMRRLEGIEPRPGHPAATLSRDARAGLALYRTNLGPSARRRSRPPARVPVQLIVATRDRYISTAMYDDAADWAPRIWRRDLRAGHWVPRSHPRAVARAISELVNHVEGGPEAAPLRRARLNGPRRDLEGRLAVVTGAGSGIGRATALALAAAGAEVIAADINLDSARATAGEAELIHAIQVDVGDAGAMEAFAADVESEYGVPSVVVNNAGIGIGGPFLDTTLADWERIVDINLWGVVHGCRLFARQMVEAGVEGQILNTASMAAYTPSRLLPAYSTTKAAVLMLSECLRAELAGAGIGVTAICPGVIDTNITRTTHIVGVSTEEERRRQEQAARAYGRRGYTPDRVAAAILRAVRRNPAVLPVAPEAHVARAISRLSPAVLRGLGRIDMDRALR
jgi:NAD(P)-dependent dehydrogenase (short-subunit alcohol dehydrogenase family)/pimeloyl-ACP methyl ester carboxylesterase